MATEKYLKVIIDGETHYIPDNRNNRQFWAKQNSRIGNGRNSNQYIATIFSATDEEVAHMTLPAVQAVVPQQASTISEIENLKSTASEVESLKNLVLQQQELLNKLMADKLNHVNGSPDPLSELPPADKPITEDGAKQQSSITKEPNDGKSNKTQTKA